jgi:hypothetical protein
LGAAVLPRNAPTISDGAAPIRRGAALHRHSSIPDCDPAPIYRGARLHHYPATPELIVTILQQYGATPEFKTPKADRYVAETISRNAGPGFEWMAGADDRSEAAPSSITRVSCRFPFNLRMQTVSIGQEIAGLKWGAPHLR